jgi:hypothetical protein
MGPRAAAWALGAWLFATAGGVAEAQVPPPIPPQNDPAKLETAKRHMEAGAAFYNDPSGKKCEEALREFTKAYELSGSLNALRGAGICALELERDGEAVELLERYLAGKGDAIEPADKKQLDADLAALRSAMARVTIDTDRDKVRITTVRTPSRGFPITNRYELSSRQTVLGLHPGSTTVTASTQGAPDQTWTIEIPNGGALQHTFKWGGGAPPPPGVVPPGDPTGEEPQPPPDEGGERPIPTTVWIFGGVTLALAIPTTIFMISASGAKSDFDAANGNAPASELESLRSDVTTMNLVSDIFLVATVASAATTAVFFFTRPTVDSSAGEGPSGAAFVPVVGPGVGGAMVNGRF